jgi:hypothetical protein
VQGKVQHKPNTSVEVLSRGYIHDTISITANEHFEDNIRNSNLVNRMQTQRGTDRASENAKDIVQHAGSLT